MENFNKKALECLDFYIDINRKTEEIFINTKKREFNTGNKYIDNVYLFHNIDRRYEGFIFLLEDYFMQNYFIHFAGHCDYDKVELLHKKYNIKIKN